jgi:hypothetical protein
MINFSKATTTTLFFLSSFIILNANPNKVEHIQFAPHLFQNITHAKHGEYFKNILSITYKNDRHNFSLSLDESEYYTWKDSFFPSDTNSQHMIFSRMTLVSRYRSYSAAYAYDILSYKNILLFNVGGLAGLIDYRQDHQIDSYSEEKELSSNIAITSSAQIGKQLYKHFGLYGFVRAEYFLNNDRMLILRYGIIFSI